MSISRRNLVKGITIAGTSLAFEHRMHAQAMSTAYDVKVIAATTSFSANVALNNRRTAAGYSWDGQRQVPTLWNERFGLHGLETAAAPGFIQAINNFDQAVGFVQDGNKVTPLLWSESAAILLDDSNYNSLESTPPVPVSINDQGIIAGDGSDAVRWKIDNGRSSSDHVPYPKVRLTTVTSNGHIGGISRIPDHAAIILWSDDAVSTFAIPEPFAGSPTLITETVLSSGEDMIYVSIIAGDIDETGFAHEVLTLRVRDGQLLPNDALSGRPVLLPIATNASEDVVGYLDDESDLIAAIWSQGNLTVLSDAIDPQLGLSITRSVDVNDHGDILSFASDRHGVEYSTILTPVR
ncbi:hypothetical protein BH23CHL5_BH23CHL5_15870 [soil metagenome]